MILKIPVGFPDVRVRGEQYKFCMWEQVGTVGTVQVLPRTVQDVGTPIDLFPTILSRAAAVRQRASLSLSSFFSSKPLRAFCSQIYLKYLTTFKIYCQKNLENFISLRNIEENQKKKSLLHLPLSNPKIHSFAFCQIEMTANNIIRAFTFTFMQSFAFCGGPMYARKKCNQSAPQHKRDTCNRCAMLIQWLQNNKNCPKPRDITHFK